MPYIGSRVVDSAGVALIEQWILALPHDAAAARSAPSTESSEAAKTLKALASRPTTQEKPPDEAIRRLVQSTEGSLALVGQMHRGALDQRTLAAAVAAGTAASSDIRGLFETFVPE